MRAHARDGVDTTTTTTTINDRWFHSRLMEKGLTISDRRFHSRLMEKGVTTSDKWFHSRLMEKGVTTSDRWFQPVSKDEYPAPNKMYVLLLFNTIDDLPMSKSVPPFSSIRCCRRQWYVVHQSFIWKTGEHVLSASYEQSFNWMM